VRDSRPDPYEAGGVAGTRPVPSQTPAVTPVPTPTVPPVMGPTKPTSGNYYDDPLLQGYIDFGHQAMNRLTGPQGIHPALQAAIDALTRMSSGGTPHMDMSYLAPFQAAVDKRQAQIDKPGWSSQQQDILRTQVSDPLMAERDAARQRVLEHLAQQGITPESGIAQQALMDTDRQFQQSRTTGERDLATREMAQEEARQQEGVSIHQMLASLGLSGAEADLQGQIAGRGQSISAAGALGNIGQGLQEAPLQHLLQAFGIAGNLANLPFQSSANAIAAQNSNNAVNVPQAQDSSAIWQTLLAVAAQGEGAFTNFLQNNAGFMQQLGMSMPQLISAFSGLYHHPATTSAVPRLPVSSGLPAMPGTPVPA
jgi:hypothetical protein